MPDVCLLFVLMFTSFIIVVTQKLVFQQSKNVTAKCTENLWHGRLYSCGSWLPEDKKANKRHGRETCCGLLPPAFPARKTTENEFIVYYGIWCTENKILFWPYLPWSIRYWRWFQLAQVGNGG